MKKPQISASVSPEHLDYIEKLAEKEKRSTSWVAAMLIEQSINERERQRLKNKKSSDGK